MANEAYVKREWITESVDSEVLIDTSDKSREWSVDIDNHEYPGARNDKVYVRTYDENGQVPGERGRSRYTGARLPEQRYTATNPGRAVRAENQIRLSLGSAREVSAPESLRPLQATLADRAQTQAPRSLCSRSRRTDKLAALKPGIPQKRRPVPGRLPLLIRAGKRGTVAAPFSLGASCPIRLARGPYKGSRRPKEPSGGPENAPSGPVREI
jgi:hypothetical protein